MSAREKHPLIFGQGHAPTGRLIPVIPDGACTIITPGWEPIGDQHKTGICVLLIHEDRPTQMWFMRWDKNTRPDGMWRGADDWNNRGDPDAFTHAFIIPAFEPKGQGDA